MDKRCIITFPPVWRDWRDVTVQHDPTIGEVKLARERGKIVLRRKTWRVGNEIHHAWVTDDGRHVVERIDYEHH